MRGIKAAWDHDDELVVTLLGQLAGTDGARATAAPFTAAPVPTAPARSPDLAHMDLRRLRTYRRTLIDEELRASYWRRLLQARRDLLRANTRPGDRPGLTRALTESRGSAGRQVILTLHPDGGLPILPHLPELWATVVDRGDDSLGSELFARLGSAESVLSSYRDALHKQLNRATTELIARYQEDPSQCLVALPLRRKAPRP